MERPRRSVLSMLGERLKTLLVARLCWNGSLHCMLLDLLLRQSKDVFTYVALSLT